jgi:hypothetical protein
VHAGVYFAVFWASTVTAGVHYAVMDGLKGGVCENKFMECRAWD